MGLAGTSSEAVDAFCKIS